MTRCIRKRLPLQQTTPAPDPGPTATALRSPCCIASVPGTPNTHPRPNPVHSRVSTRDNVTFLRQPCPGHDPHTPHTRPACAPSLRDFSPLSSLQSRSFANPVFLCHAAPHFSPRTPRRRYRFGHDRRRPQLRDAHNVAESNRFRLLEYPVHVEVGSETNRMPRSLAAGHTRVAGFSQAYAYYVILAQFSATRL